jgi:hypothetical protein
MTGLQRTSVFCPASTGVALPFFYKKTAAPEVGAAVIFARAQQSALRHRECYRFRV